MSKNLHLPPRMDLILLRGLVFYGDTSALRSAGRSVCPALAQTHPRARSATPWARQRSVAV